jgi:hypothetical protein
MGLLSVGAPSEPNVFFSTRVAKEQQHAEGQVFSFIAAQHRIIFQETWHNFNFSPPLRCTA